MTFRRALLAAAALCFLIPLAGCSGGDDPGTAPIDQPVPPASSAPPAAKALDFATVESLTAPRFQQDPNCGYGEWSANSTGIDEQFRANAKTIQQFDCYLSKDDVGGIPKRIQQSIYVEFDNADSAKAFAENESSLYSSLVDGPRVVVTGTGLETVDMMAYLADLQKACGCGEVLAAG